MKKKRIYFCGIWWIGVSALARYYLSQWYEVWWSDNSDSELIHSLICEGCDIIIWSDENRITNELEKIIYSEAVPLSQKELSKWKELDIPLLKYSQGLWEIVNEYNLIAVTGTHGKSTTSSMISQILKNSRENFVSIVWTLLKEFEWKNFYRRWEDRNLFVIEACEYKEHFLAYKPLVWVITNIEYDHADFFKTPESYVLAFKKFIDNIKPWGFCLLPGDDSNAQSLHSIREDINYISVFDWYFEFEAEKVFFPKIILHIPWNHILFDAKLAYIVGHLVWIDEITVLESLEEYSGVWRRMEKIWYTKNNNLLMSDYGHHPTEVLKTLSALKEWNPEKKLFVVFQPHQYSRTIELLEGFKDAFVDADSLLIPNIYESRDSQEDKNKMNTDIFVEHIHHSKISNWQWLDNSVKLIENYDDEHPNSSIILLLWAWNVDTLRYKIKTEL